MKIINTTQTVSSNSDASRAADPAASVDNPRVRVGSVSARPLRLAQPLGADRLPALSYADIVKDGGRARARLTASAGAVAETNPADTGGDMFVQTAPSRLGGSTNFFQYDNELYQHFSTAGSEIIYSADAVLDLSEAGLCANLKSKDYEIYAETIILPARLDCRNLTLVCRALSRAEPSKAVSITAKENWSPTPDKDGFSGRHDGQPGEAGANVRIQVLDSNDCLDWLWINAGGAKGGDGYDNPDAEKAGGNGGDGGVGGDVTIIAPSQYGAISDQLKVCLTTDLYDKYAAVNELISAIKKDKHGDIQASVVTEIKDANENYINEIFVVVANDF